MKTALWRQGVLATAALLLGSVAQGAPAQDLSALKEVPAKAALVIHIRGIQGVAERVVHLLKQVAPQESAEIRKKIEKGLQDGIEGRKFRGLPKDGAVFVVFTEVPKVTEEPKLAVIAAVKNYRDFVDSILKEEERKELKKSDAGYESTKVENDKTTYFLNRNGYVVITQDKELIESLAKKQAGLDGKLSKQMAANLLASDLGIYVNMEQVNEEYGAQIKLGKGLLEQVIRAAKDMASKEQKPQLEMAEKAIDPIFQSLEDSQALLFSAEVRPGGVDLHAEAEVGKGTDTGKFLAQMQVSSFKDLDRLPAGQLFYTGFQTSPALFKAMGGMAFGVVADLDAKEMKSAKEAIEQLVKANPKTMIGSASLQVWTYAEPAKAMAAQLKLLESLGAGHSYLSGMLKEKPVIKPKARKYGDFEFTSVKLNWDLEKMVEQASAELNEDQKKALLAGFKKMLGEEINAWYGSDGKHLVQVTAKSWPAAEKLLDDYFKGQSAIGKVVAFSAVRKELPAETSIVFLFDLVRYVDAIVNYVKPLLQTQGKFPANYPPAVAQDKLNFAGMAITLVPQRGSFDLYFSTQSLKDTFETFIRPLLPKGI